VWSSVFKENECAVVPGPKISVVVDVKMCVEWMRESMNLKSDLE